MQLKQITATKYRHETELMCIDVEKKDKDWVIWIQTRENSHNHVEATFNGAVAFATTFWRDLIGKEFRDD